MSEPLTKVDSAVQGLSSSPPKEKGHRRASSSAAGVVNIDDLVEESKPLEVAPETQKTGWKINTSPMTIEEKEILKKHLTNPPVKKIDLHFPMGKVVTARNLREGVTIKDALDAIHKPNKKRDDDELGDVYLAGFAWRGLREGNTEEEKKEEWTRLHVVLQSTPGATNVSSGKKKKNKHAEE